MKQMQQKRTAASALAFVALAWGAAYAVIKDALNTYSPFQLLFFRFLLATLILAVIFHRRLGQLGKENLIIGSKIGIFLFLAFATMILGIQRTTASKLSFILGIYVLIVPFLSMLVTRKRPEFKTVVGAVLAAAGIGLLTLNQSLTIGRGDLISLSSSFFFAVHMLMIERYSGKCDAILSTLVQFGLCAVLFGALTGVFEAYTPHITPHGVLGLGYIVLFSTVIAFLVQNIAQKYLNASSTALILSLETGFGGIFAVLLLHEAVTQRMIVGGSLILAGIAAGEVKWSKRGKDLQERENLNEKRV